MSLGHEWKIADDEYAETTHSSTISITNDGATQAGLGENSELLSVDANSPKFTEVDSSTSVDNGDVVNTSDSSKKSGWFPGKYLGFQKRNTQVDTLITSSTNEEHHNNDSSDSSVQQSTLISCQEVKLAADGSVDNVSSFSASSSSFTKLSNYFSLSSSTRASDSQQRGGDAGDGSRENENDTSESKKESMICFVVRSIRQKYLDRQLIGRIYIYRLSGVIATAVTSDVTAEDLAQFNIDLAEKSAAHRESVFDSDPMVQAELTGQYKRALTLTDTILNSLERRSLAWATSMGTFAHNTLLTRGTTIGVSDPFIGMIGLSFTIELSATAGSLLASRKRFEATREIALETISRRESFDSDQDGSIKGRSSSASSSTFSLRDSFSMSNMFSSKAGMGNSNNINSSNGSASNSNKRPSVRYAGGDDQLPLTSVGDYFNLSNTTADSLTVSDDKANNNDTGNDDGVDVYSNSPNTL